MASAIAGFTPTTPAKSASSTGGVNSMGADQFLNLMITQLQQQDPLNPTDSNQLLTQMSQISTLQSNTLMAENIKGLTLQQSIGAGGNLIGKTVKGIDGNGDEVDGIVTSVKVENKEVFLELDSAKSLPLSNITTIASTSSNADAALLAALPNLSSNIKNISTNSNSWSKLLSLLGGTSQAGL